MMRLVAALALLLLPAVAYAQPKQVVTTCGSGVTLGVGDGSPGTLDTTGAACVTVSTLSNHSPTDRSSAITLGGLAQTLMAANTSRHGCSIQNQSSNDLWIISPGTASAIQPSTWLPAGAYYTCPTGGTPTGAFSIFGATTGQTFAAAEW